MPTFESNNCATARQQLATDAEGRHWEHYFIEGRYSFSNQIPNRNSFTATEPGQVFYDRGLCRWGVDNPNNVVSNNATTMAPGNVGGAGLLLLLGIIGAGVYAWYYTSNDERSSDYHPMADVPPMPWVSYDRAAAAAATAAVDQPAQGNTDTAPLTDSIADSQQPAQPNEDGVIDVPWDEPSPTVGEPVPTENPDTVPTRAEVGPGGLDKLKGVSLKDFKAQLAQHGITTESGAFKSVELLNYPGTQNILHARMLAFWKEFSSRRIPHAVYFVFGLQDGGNRSPAFKEKFITAKTWVANWYKENLPND